VVTWLPLDLVYYLKLITIEQLVGKTGVLQYQPVGWGDRLKNDL